MSGGRYYVGYSNGCGSGCGGCLVLTIFLVLGVILMGSC